MRVLFLNPSSPSCLRCCLAAALALVATWCSAAEFDQAKLDAIAPRMQKFVDEGVVAGAVTVVGNAQGVVKYDAVGYQNLESKQEMPRNAVFRIASMTKPITAIGIMILQDQGKLSVEDPVEKHLPEFKGQMLLVKKEDGTLTLVKPQRPITIRDLLTHTSGLPGGFPAGYSDLYFTRQFTLKEATLAQSQRSLEFEPGSKWAYCNAGIDTLGRIIEVVSGQPYENFLHDNLFEPLDMDDTTFYPSEEQLSRLAGLYGEKDGKLVFADYQLIGPTKDAKHPIPAGGLFSTGGDLSTLYQAMLNGGWFGITKAGDKRVFTTAAAQQMTSLQTGDLQCGFTPGMGFGFGWAVIKEPQGVHAMLSKGTYGHGGAFGTQAWIDPQQGFFVILLIQRTGLPNADGSDLRRDLQRLTVEAIKR
jgi:CubicO group peptidase (beta-lactamase class C family)